MKTATLKIVFAITNLFSLSFATDYYLSFQITSVNNQIVANKIEYSKAMTHSSAKRKFLFSFPTDCKSIEKMLENNKDKIFNLLLKEDILVTSTSLINNRFYEKSKISYLPKRFDIIIKNQVAYFYSKEDN